MRRLQNRFRLKTNDEQVDQSYLPVKLHDAIFWHQYLEYYAVQMLLQEIGHYTIIVDGNDQMKRMENGLTANMTRN